MSKRSKIKKRSYKSDTDDILGLAKLGIKAGVTVNVLGSVLSATKQ